MMAKQFIDGNQFGVCFRTKDQPIFKEILKEFAVYHVNVRLDTKNNWVFLRSSDQEMILKMVKEKGDEYFFREITNSKSHTQSTEESFHSAYRTKIQQNNSHSNSFENDAQIYENHNTGNHIKLCEPEYRFLRNKPADVKHVVFIGVPDGCSLDDISDLCTDVGVVPYGLSIEYTPQKNRYSSVYVRSEEDVFKLVTAENMAFNGKKIIVDSADNVLNLVNVIESGVE